MTHSTMIQEMQFVTTKMELRQLHEISTVPHFDYKTSRAVNVKFTKLAILRLAMWCFNQLNVGNVYVKNFLLNNHALMPAPPSVAPPDVYLSIYHALCGCVEFVRIPALEPYSLYFIVERLFHDVS